MFRGSGVGVGVVYVWCTNTDKALLLAAGAVAGFKGLQLL